MLQMTTKESILQKLKKRKNFSSLLLLNEETAFYWYNQKENRSVLEVLVEFPSVQMPFEWLVQLTPPLKKRAFSISSSPLVHPNQIHLTVSIVSWRTPLKRTRHGLCSTWLAGLCPNKENIIPCWIHRGSLPRPQPSIPLMLIGQGTGCAPFRAFVEERAAQRINLKRCMFKTK